MAAKKDHTAPNMEQFKEILKDKKLKATNQRLAVHEAMLTLGHASADMVVDAINACGGAKVTVASGLERLDRVSLHSLALFLIYVCI